jgi:hypothetical protein
MSSEVRAHQRHEQHGHEPEKKAPGPKVSPSEITA